jgi:hypothetical protein
MVERRRTSRGPALRAEDEEAAADDIRRVLRTAGNVPIEPDPRVATMLAPGEQVLAFRREVTVAGGPSPREHEPGRGDLYVTDRRLIVLGDTRLTLRLERILEAEIRERRLLLRVKDADWLSVGVDDPRVLRVQIGAARADRRRGRPSTGD